MISPKAATRLFAWKRLFLLALLCVSADARGGTSPAAALAEKDIRRGEGVVAELRRLEQLTVAGPDFRSYGALIRKMYPGLFVKASELGDGDLKTDLTTAVFLYEQAFHALKNRGTGVALDCGDELRSVYARVCVENKTDTAAKLLWAKARLHTGWAAALIKYHRGGADAATLATMEEMRAERRNDLLLAERAVAALKTLGTEVCAYPSLAEFEERKTLARVPFERLAANATAALQSIDRILRSLPRGPLFYPLDGARNAYHDGLFWWHKTYRREKLVVAVNSLAAPDEARALGLDTEVVNYTVVINWRNAARRTRQAEDLIAQARRR